MEDQEIIELYWKKNENAISETDKKYGKYCNSIAYNIVKNSEDAEECVNDTYLKTWNTIPPTRPNYLKLFLGKITRNLAIHKYEKVIAQKRSAEMEIVLGELEECIASKENIENQTEYNELVEILNDFLEKLPTEKRNIFMDRYWNLDSIKTISCKYKVSENNIKVVLYRLRNQLKHFLNERGVVV